MKNLFKMYRDWRNRKFVEKINKIYFKQDNDGNLLWKEACMFMVKTTV